MAEQITATIPTKDSRDRVNKYLQVLYKFHKLTSREIDVLTEVILNYIDLRKAYTEVITYKLLFDSDTRKKIRKSLNNMDDSQFQNYLSALRRKKVIKKDNTIFPMYIPPVGEFELIVKFK